MVGSPIGAGARGRALLPQHVWSGWGAVASVRAASFARDLVAVTLAERERWPLWTPVGLGLGIGLYFALPSEPPPWIGLVLAALALGAAAIARSKAAWFVAALAATAVTGGFAVAQLRTQWVAAPVLLKELRPVEVIGRVVENAARESGRRLVLDRPRISGLEPSETPERVRVTVRQQPGAPLAPGDWVSLRAALLPPPRPAAPGAFDFARKAYFARLGAVGFAFGPAMEITPPAGESPGGLDVTVGRLRHQVTARIVAGLEGQAGAVAAALLTGERGAIAATVLAAMRDAGLAHLLAISGLHLGLVAAIVFFVVRALLALCEPVALRYPIKKWAALIALAGTAFYLLLSGVNISTQRAFLMSGLVITAIVLDRTWLSMRSVAWAATAVLLIQPESLLGPSFQMSFAAVVGLVAVFERSPERPAPWFAGGGGLRRPLVYLTVVALCTLVAGLATAPFAVYHFNRLAVYGLAANLLAVPITALWIMPWGLAALALMPVGLESWALAPMGWGIDAVIAVAVTVAGWPGSVLLVPAMPAAGLILAVGGGLWLCLWRHGWRWLGVLAFAAGMLLTPGLTRAPDLLVDGKGKLFAVRAADGRLALSSSRAARFSGKMWLRRAGQATSAPWPGDDARLRCDATGCIYRTNGRVVALVRDGRALDEDCRVSDVVVSAVPVRRHCPSAQLVIDRIDLWRSGAHAVTFEKGGEARVESVAARRGQRPWTHRPGG